METKPTELIRVCGNCEKEFMYENVIAKYPEPLHLRIAQLWKDSRIRFFCRYCYLLKIIQEIKKKK
ncbi:MAG: hypothetical protein ACW986_08790 [Promethearchaeota archaeon]